MSGTDRFRPASVVVLAVVAVASIAAVAGFRAVFVDWSFMAAAVLGGVGGSLVVALSWWRRLLIGESIALAVLALVLVGAVAAGGVPTPDAFGSLFDGLRSGWADLLSLTPPADVTPELRVLPFVLAWIGVTIGGELLRRTDAPALAMLGPLVALTVSALVTAEDRAIAAVQGAVIASAALVIGVSRLVVRRRPSGAVDHAALESGRDPAIGRVARAGAVVVLVAVFAPLVGPRLPFADAHERFDLRDRNEPPWDPLAVPSPLVQLKSSLRDERRDEVAFTVTSEETITRWNLATLGDFDGVVWTVGSGSGRAASSEFRPVGTSLPDPPVAAEQTSSVSATIEIGELRGPWLPAAGWPTGLGIDDGPGELDVRMNLTTGTLAVPSGLTSAFGYTIEGDLAVSPVEAELSDLDISPDAVATDLEVIPPPIRNLAADLLEGIDPGWDQVAAVRDRFVTDGFYDTSPESRPGHSYFRLAEFLADPEKLVGYEEQYAAAAATITRIAMLPTRVVVGYVIPESRYEDGRAEVLVGDISAWIEIDAGTAGWMPFDVTPDRSREPVSDVSGVSVEEVAVPNPPPPPQVPPDVDVFASEEEPDEDEEERDDEDEVTATAGVSAAVVLGATVGGVVMALLLIALAVVFAKTQRRKRRRRAQDPAERVGYAWQETLDRYREAGLDVPDRATPREVVSTVLAEEPSAPERERELRSMVAVVQRAAYHAEPPDTEDADRAWQYYDHVVGAMHEHRRLGRRIRMGVDPRPLASRGWTRPGADR